MLRGGSPAAFSSGSGVGAAWTRLRSAAALKLTAARRRKAGLLMMGRGGRVYLEALCVQ